MQKYRSKFDFQGFIGGYDEFGVSKERYTEDEAIALFAREYMLDDGEYEIAVCDAFVKWRIGWMDGEKHIGYWLEYDERITGSIPCYAIHIKSRHHDIGRFEEHYRVKKIEIKEGEIV